MSAKQYPTVEYVRQALRYEDGRLFWLRRPREHFADDVAFIGWNKKYAGKEAGVKVQVGVKLKSPLQRPNLRWNVSINNVKIYRHLIVWALHHGEWPTSRLDHKDRDSTNDRIENLRLATQTQNRMNSIVRWNKENRLKGVFWDRRNKKWFAKLGKRYLASFDKPEDAYECYLMAAREKFGDFVAE